MKTIIIRSFDNYIEANFASGTLAEAGIQSFFQDEFTTTIFPMLGNAIGGVKLAVEEHDVDAARKILDEMDEARRQKMHCPKCSSADVQYISVSKPGNWLTAFFSFLFASYSVAPEKAYHCYNCGFEFPELPNDISAETSDQ